MKTVSIDFDAVLVSYVADMYPAHYTIPYVSTVSIDFEFETNWDILENHSAMELWKDINVDATETVPDFYKTEAKIVWNSNYLFILARLADPLISIQNNVTGHNLRPPYLDNDFEIFLDPSQTGVYYKEFEINRNNATYDVLWGLPDQDVAFAGRCFKIQGNSTFVPQQEEMFVPFCQNTTFRPDYNGSWTMKSAATGRGLQSATFSSDFHGRFNSKGFWTMQVAMPLESDGYTHGGLLDTFQNDKIFEKHHPRNGGYWSFALSRAVHPKRMDFECPNPDNSGKASSAACNLSTKKNPGYLQESAQLVNDAPSKDYFREIMGFRQGLLGIDSWNSYWEFTVKSLPKPYMHAPYSWQIAEFTNTSSANIDGTFTGRHVASSIFYAYANYTGTLHVCPKSVEDLLDYCFLQCDPTILELLVRSTKFRVSFHGDFSWWRFVLKVALHPGYDVSMSSWGNMTVSRH